MLRTALTKHPDIYISNEIFHPDFSSDEIVAGGLSSIFSHWFENAPDKKIKMAIIHLTHAKPADTMTQGTDCYKIWNMIYNNPSIKVVMLRRASYLRRYVSHLIAGETGVYVTYNESDRVQQKVVIDPIAYFENIIRTDQLYSETLANLQDHQLKLCIYESMLGNFSKTCSEIFSFLNLPDVNVTPDTIKREIRSMENVVENYQELKKFFINHPYALY